MAPGRPQEISPLNLFQERYADDPWRLLACTICLNLCSGAALEGVHLELFERWPTPLDMTLADRVSLEQTLRHLGMQRIRARRLVSMSAAYACWWNGRDPDDLPGIGKYGADSYRIFCRGELDIQVEDKELRKYLEWIRTR